MVSTTEAFANSCDDAADWRESRASEDGDIRHLHCAEALRTAAAWARGAEDAEQRLAVLLPGVIQSGTGFLLLDDRAQRVFAAYCLDGPEEFDAWLRRVAEADRQAGYDEGLDQLMGDGT
jgi:hypothetical protein